MGRSKTQISLAAGRALKKKNRKDKPNFKTRSGQQQMQSV